MQNNINIRPFSNKLRVIFSIVLLEYLLFIFSGVSFSNLFGNGFFSLEVDPAFWIVYLFKIPHFITANHWAGVMADTSIVLLLLWLIINPFNNKIAILLFLLLLLFYMTLMGHLAHRNYQFGFFMVMIPFFFKNEANRSYAFETTRYFLLFFYVSAALLKLSNNALAGQEKFSHLLGGQFTPYFLEGNTGMRTAVNLYLINHPAAAYCLYLASFIAETTTIIGFFTKKFDKWIGVILLVFHFGNWFIMDIAPFGHIAFICLLFLTREMGLKQDGEILSAKSYS